MKSGTESKTGNEWQEINLTKFNIIYLENNMISLHKTVVILVERIWDRYCN